MSIEYSGMLTQCGVHIIYDLIHPNPLLNELNNSKNIDYSAKEIRKPIAAFESRFTNLDK